jgi:peptide/nickel transport system substrate-binding protein
MKVALCAVTMLSTVALGAARPVPGGVLRLATVDPIPDESPLFSDRPLEVTFRALTQLPLCRLAQVGEPSPSLLERTELQADQATLWFRPRPPSAPEGWGPPADVLQSLAAVSASASPYRALLASLKKPDGTLSLQVSAKGLEGAMAFPWPDLDSALCHPAFWLPGSRGPGGPFRREGDSGTANAFHPRGRPHVDGFRWVAQQERAASRLFRLKQVDLVLGAGSVTLGTTHPYVTFVGLGPARREAGLRRALESVLDRQELIRSFVQAPAVALSGFSDSSAPAGALPAEWVLIFDAASQDARAVAERLQLKLRAAGSKLTLQGLSRAELWRRWSDAKGFDLALLSLLMPPQPANTLAVLLEAGAHPARLAELSTLGAIPVRAARDLRAMERMTALTATLPLIPLYGQGLALTASDRVRGLSSDLQGIVRLDDVSLVQE